MLQLHVFMWYTKLIKLSSLNNYLPIVDQRQSKTIQKRPSNHQWSHPMIIMVIRLIMKAVRTPRITLFPRMKIPQKILKYVLYTHMQHAWKVNQRIHGLQCYLLKHNWIFSVNNYLYWTNIFTINEYSSPLIGMCTINYYFPLMKLFMYAKIFTVSSFWYYLLLMKRWTAT